MNGKFDISTFIGIVMTYLMTILEVLYNILLSTIKAFLPCGVVPRKSVAGNVVLITGSGSGLGRLMAIEFAKLGAKLVLWDVNEASNLETLEILEAMGTKVHAYTIDLSNREAIYATAKQVQAEIGDVDILINNAGIVSGLKIFSCPDSLVEKTMAVNCNALFWTAKAFIPKMLERNSGHVVTIASMAGHLGVSGLVDYCASKHAAVGFNDALRAEIQTLDRRVTVTTVNPHYINTGMFNGVKTYSDILFPLLEPDYVIERIMEAVLTDTDELYIPKASSIFVFLKGALPAKAIQIVAKNFKVNETMDEFVGRKSMK